MNLVSPVLGLLALALLVATCSAAYEAGDAPTPWRSRRLVRLSALLGLTVVLVSFLAGRFYG